MEGTDDDFRTFVVNVITKSLCSASKAQLGQGQPLICSIGLRIATMRCTVSYEQGEALVIHTIKRSLQNPSLWKPHRLRLISEVSLLSLEMRQKALLPFKFVLNFLFYSPASRSPLFYLRFVLEDWLIFDLEQLCEDIHL